MEIHPTAEYVKNSPCSVKTFLRWGTTFVDVKNDMLMIVQIKVVPISLAFEGSISPIT